MTSKEIVVHFLSLALGVASLILGVQTKFFSVIQNDNTALVLASFSLGFFFFLAGERLVIRDLMVAAAKDSGEKLDKLRRSIPQTQTLLRFTTCDDALIDVAEHLPRARAIYNTHISRDGIPSGHVATTTYKAALQKAIERGARMVDIVSPSFISSAKELQELARQCSGEYQYHELDVTAPCFLNFIVLEYGDGNTDCWIGWATSRGLGMEQPAFRIRDGNTAKYFAQYHQALRNQ